MVKNYCTNRIKPKLLREQKTEALLVFVRTTLEQYFKIMDDEKTNYAEFGTKEDTQYIYNKLNKLFKYLQKHVVNASYIQALIANSSNSRALSILALKEKPMILYYNSLAKTIERKLPKGSNWIPELMVVCLLSEWILEEAKSTYLYPFLNDFNYLELMNKFEKSKLDTMKDKKEVIINMYQLSTFLIDSLKKSTSKIKSKKNKRNKK